MRALSSAYFFKLNFAGGTYVTSLVAWASVRAYLLRVIGYLRTPCAGRGQLRRPGLHKQGLQECKGQHDSVVQLVVPDYDSGPQEKRAVQVVYLPPLASRRLAICAPLRFRRFELRIESRHQAAFSLERHARYVAVWHEADEHRTGPLLSVIWEDQKWLVRAIRTFVTLAV